MESKSAKLEALIRKGKTGRKKFITTRALLLYDTGSYGPAWTVANVAKALGGLEP